MAPALTPPPTPVPFISGNARDFAPEASTTSGADRLTGGGLFTPLVSTAVMCALGAFALQARQAKA